MQVFFKIVIDKIIKELSDNSYDYLAKYRLYVNWKFTVLEHIVRIGILIRMNLQFTNLD